MNSSINIYTSSCSTSDELLLYPDSVLFHGRSVDTREESAINFKNEKISKRILVEYDYHKMTIKVGEQEIIADKATEIFQPYIQGKNVVLESTTLDFSELFFAVRSLVDLEINNFLIIYVEPKIYNRIKPGSDTFALSELNTGYKPIPRSIIDLAGNDVDAGVFFLGYESQRLERAFEEYQMLSSKDIKVIFGLPAYHPGWELNAIVPHLKVIENLVVSYCAANDPGSAYDTLEITRRSLSNNKKMFVAPIGTKPCGVAAALFACIHSSQVGLLYDHREKKKDRTDGVGVWHRYSIKILLNE